MTDAKGHAIEGGYVFVVRGQGFDGRDFRFNDIELITDKKEYQAGDTVKLMVNTDRADSTIVLFVRPVNGDLSAAQGNSAEGEKHGGRHCRREKGHA